MGDKERTRLEDQYIELYSGLLQIHDVYPFILAGEAC